MGSPWELPYQRLPRAFCKDQNSSALLGEKIIATCFNKLLSYPKCVLLHAPECPLASRSHHWLQFSLPKLESRCFGMPAPTSSTCSWAPLPPITPSWPGNETCLSLFAQNSHTWISSGASRSCLCSWEAGAVPGSVLPCISPP